MSDVLLMTKKCSDDMSQTKKRRSTYHASMFKNLTPMKPAGTTTEGSPTSTNEQQVAVAGKMAIRQTRADMLGMLNQIPEWKNACNDIAKGLEGKALAENRFTQHRQLPMLLNECRKWGSMSRITVAAICATLIILGDDELSKVTGFNHGNLTESANGVNTIWKHCRVLMQQRKVMDAANACRSYNLLDRMRMYNPLKLSLEAASVETIERLIHMVMDELNRGAVDKKVALADWCTSCFSCISANEFKKAVEQDANAAMNGHL
eukprot:gene11430-13508_t